ncbi:AdoMet-dependent rRNA methyltransferase spb1 [Trichoderma virens FT-333]|nr:AdoMet-dependent rRNA methyltransferase spb1 [Trichoderma virens FT-333]
MAIQKKHGKGRLDKWYKLAKEKGYRARSAFKLVQLNKKYGFLEKSKVLLDLCAAPGGWLQVAAETMPVNSLIVGVDLAPIKPIPRVITFQSDITTDKCRATIRQHFKTWKADAVLHDGAPNVGTAWAQDSFNQAELALHSLKLATEFLAEGGTRSHQTPSSRNVSAEIFVVCRGYKAPKHIDPRLLDARSVFAELSGATPNNEAKVYNPEVKKRKRDGYEDGDYIQFKEIAASSFIQTNDPIAILGSYNKLSFAQAPNGDIALAALDKLPETTAEIRECCADLKVLGRKEFKLLLKWRLRVREIFGLSQKKSAATAEAEEVVGVESMDEELRIQEELQALKDTENAKRKRERRKENEQKRKEIIRMQLNMMAPMDIGMEESGPLGEGAMFSLKTIDKTGGMNRFSRGKMAVSNSKEPKDLEEDISTEPVESDSEEDHLDTELDAMYEQFRERKLEADAKYRAKKARKEHKDDEWEGLSADEEAESDASELEEDDDSSDDDEDGSLPTNGFLTDLDEITGGSLLGEEEDETTEASSTNARSQVLPTRAATQKASLNEQEDDSEDDGGFEVVKADDDDNWEDRERRQSDGRPDIDIITAEAMTLAHQLATGQKTTHDAIDDGFNKRAFRDRDGLPEWFLDDEGKHDKPMKPITKAAANAIKEKLRAFNARPIKKVREAKARKKFKTAQKLEKLKKKSDMLAADEGMTEKEKAESISKLISRANRQKPRQPAKLVVARGLNKGIQGRPKGVKGRYRIVDARMKKELRAQKRIQKRKK